MTQAEKDKDLLWRLTDIREELMRTMYDGSRQYGCDEWSTPVVNLTRAIALLEKDVENATRSL